ncbi:MAG: hypothetical protein PSV16_00470 [Flavobacterium sp.]|nr:hypothetical protein [Flavobacterium sp.]
MFAEITQEDVIASIESSKKKAFSPSRQGIFYSIWYDGVKYPAKEIIDRYYELNNKINPNPGFNTDAAQDRLLELGFPVVQNNLSRESDFFSQKDLISFFKLIGRKKYDASNPTDHNIGKYLNRISWGKTQYWANLLRDERWDIEGRKQWNSQHKQLKQIYKEYTWFRIIPKNTKNRLVYFTVGIDRFWHKRLILKIDIQRENPFFNPERQKYFDTTRINLGIEHKMFEINDITNYDWKKIVGESLAFIEGNIEHYHRTVSEINNLKTIKAARICWNSYGWTEPSGRDGKSMSNSFESRTGFANDEWLFDLDSTLNGYCYARIEPVNKSRNKLKGSQIDLMLFTQKQGDGNMRWVGKISNVSVVNEEESKRVYQSQEGRLWQENRFDQLEKIDGVLSSEYFRMAEGDFYNIRFRPENVEVFEDNLLVADGLFKLQRYILYDFDSEGEMLAQKQEESFEPSNNGQPAVPPSPPKKIKKTFTAGTIEYDNTHKEIQNALIIYLTRNYPQAKITSENSREINNRKVDLVMKQDGRKIYFEVKSYPSLRASIRVALGQLIEYCFFCDSSRATELVIVSHIKTTGNVEKFMAHLRKTLRLNIHYHQFDLKAGELKDWVF